MIIILLLENYILAIMKNYILLFVLPVILLSCGIARNINCIKLKKTKVHLTHDRKMWTEHLKLKKGNYFIYYGSIFGIERIATTRGNYTVKGDSLYLFFCSPEQATDTGYIDHQERAILLSKNADFNRDMYVKKGNLNRLK
jgi:hypothetical protein